MSLLVADVRALAAGAYESLIVFGGATIDDGGGGLYYWDAAASDADDGAEWIKPTSVDAGSPGRWHRVEPYALPTHTHTGVYQPADAELTALATTASAADTLPYFTGSGTASVTTLSIFGRTLIDDADNSVARTTLGLGTIATQAANSVSIGGGAITGITDLAIADGGTGASTAAAAFTALKQAATESATGVVELATSAETAAGLAIQASDTRIHVPVTVSGSPNYFTLSGQDLVRALVNLSSHVTGTLPFASVAGRTVVTESGTTHTNAAGDIDKWVRFTGSGTKTYTISSGVYAATNVLAFFNANAAGTLTVASSGMTLTGNLVFAPLKGGIIYFTSGSAADVVGGSSS